MTPTGEFEFVEGTTSDISFVARGDTREQALAYTEDMSRKKTVILVRPDEVMSWDHRKLSDMGVSY